MAVPLYGYNNRVDGALLSDGAWDSTYGLAKLQNSNISIPARTSSAAASATRFRFDLQACYTLRTLGIARHTLSDGAYWRARVGLSPLDIDFGVGTGDSRMTASGGANGTYFNENGVLASGAAPRYDYDRLSYVNGLLNNEDFTASGWSFSPGTSPLDVRTIVFHPTGTMQAAQSGLDLAVDTYRVTGRVRLMSGDGTFRFVLNNGSTNPVSPQQVATTKWANFTLDIVNGTAALNGNGLFAIDRSFLSTEAVLQFENLRLQRGTASRPYRKTATARIYQCRGVLSEEARTNIIRSSGDLSNATYWPQNGVTFPSGITAPDGTASAFKFMREDTSNVFHQISGTAQSNYATTSYYTQHLFVQAGVGTRSIVLIMSLTANGFAQATFTLSSGTFSAGSVGTGGTNPWSNASARCYPLGGGIYWLTLTAQTGATAGAGTAIVRLDNGTGLAYTGDGASGHYVWGADLQPGNEPTSYVPTTTASATRTMDIPQITGSNFSGFYPSTQKTGTLYTELSPRSDSAVTNTCYAAVISDGTTANRIEINSRTSDDKAVASVFQSSVAQSSQATAYTFPYDGTYAKVAVCYDTNSVKMATNGTLSTLDNAATIPTALSQLDIGQRLGAANTSLNGWIKRVAWWPWALDDTQLAAITTSGPGAFDYDSGWIPALQFGFAQEDVPSDWGQRGYNLLTAFDARAARYGTVEIMDPNNSAGYVDLGRMYVCGGWQPAYGPSYGTIEDSRNDLSTTVVAESGKEFDTERARPKERVQSFKFLTQSEANELHQMQDAVGTVKEVVFVPDPADMGLSQEYGGLGKLKPLSPIDYAYQMTRGTSIGWKEKR